jgi:hypothetical protein
MPATYGSAVHLAAALRREAEARGHDEEETRHPGEDWYAHHVAGEQSRHTGEADPGTSA